MQTERLLLRRFTEDDAAAFFPLASDPQILRYTGEQPKQSVEDVRQMICERQLRDYELHGYGRMACIEKSSGRLIGFSGLKYLPEFDEPDIGYRFLVDCWGKGYATESASFLMQQGILEFGLKRVIGLVDPDNHASASVLRKLGLAWEKRINPEYYASGLDYYGLSLTAVSEN
ncbi:MAG: GNAT family N-acetyltransferase [Burkholderiaceae bacterium]|nr:GNAT family N-acetyltransferase [Burkholderiaceae bacterium]